MNAKERAELDERVAEWCENADYRGRARSALQRLASRYAAEHETAWLEKESSFEEVLEKLTKHQTFREVLEQEPASPLWSEPKPFDEPISSVDARRRARSDELCRRTQLSKPKLYQAVLDVLYGPAPEPKPKGPGHPVRYTWEDKKWLFLQWFAGTADAEIERRSAREMPSVALGAVKATQFQQVRIREFVGEIVEHLIQAKVRRAGGWARVLAAFTFPPISMRDLFLRFGPVTSAGGGVTGLYFYLLGALIATVCGVFLIIFAPSGRIVPRHAKTPPAALVVKGERASLFGDAGLTSLSRDVTLSSSDDLVEVIRKNSDLVEENGDYPEALQHGLVFEIRDVVPGEQKLNAYVAGRIVDREHPQCFNVGALGLQIPYDDTRSACMYIAQYAGLRTGGIAFTNGLTSSRPLQLGVILTGDPSSRAVHAGRVVIANPSYLEDVAEKIPVSELLAPWPDSDGDGLPDEIEIKFHGRPDQADSDGDGLSDGYEYAVLNTHPMKKDSDYDGINDGEELARGTEPLVDETYLDSRALRVRECPDFIPVYAQVLNTTRSYSNHKVVTLSFRPDIDRPTPVFYALAEDRDTVPGVTRHDSSHDRGQTATRNGKLYTAPSHFEYVMAIANGAPTVGVGYWFPPTEKEAVDFEMTQGLALPKPDQTDLGSVYPVVRYGPNSGMKNQLPKVLLVTDPGAHAALMRDGWIARLEGFSWRPQCPATRSRFWE